jgi:hypothetical protein
VLGPFQLCCRGRAPLERVLQPRRVQAEQGARWFEILMYSLVHSGLSPHLGAVQNRCALFCVSRRSLRFWNTCSAVICEVKTPLASQITRRYLNNRVSQLLDSLGVIDQNSQLGLGIAHEYTQRREPTVVDFVS